MIGQLKYWYSSYLYVTNQSTRLFFITCLKGDWERTQGYIYSYMCTSSNLLFRDGSNTKTIQHQKEYLYCLSLVLVLGIFNAVLNNRRYKRRGVYLFLVSRGCHKELLPEGSKIPFSSVARFISTRTKGYRSTCLALALKSSH